MGWGAVEKGRGGEKYLACGCETTDKGSPPEERLASLFSAVKKLVSEYQPGALAVEDLFFAKNAKTAFAVGQAKGVILLAAAQSKVPVFTYTPLQVKMSITGYGRASKSQVQDMVVRLLNLEETPRPDDAADGLAIALTHCFSRKSREVRK